MVVCDFGDQRVTSVGLTCVSSAAFVGITNRFVILYVDCTDCVQLLASTKFVLYMRYIICLLYTSPSPRDRQKSRMPSSA